jgi:hypothetical protein
MKGLMKIFSDSKLTGISEEMFPFSVLIPHEVIP